MNDASPMMTIYSGQKCIGFLLRRGREGVEAFTADEISIGKFASVKEATSAVSNAFAAASGCASCGE
jgi:hypothetical protein